VGSGVGLSRDVVRAAVNGPPHPVRAFELHTPSGPLNCHVIENVPASSWAESVVQPRHVTASVVVTLLIVPEP
jgi:hypothetical protein